MTNAGGIRSPLVRDQSVGDAESVSNERSRMGAEKHRMSGQRMVLHAEEWLRQQGCVKVKLQVEDAGQEAVSFYERLGYKVQLLVSMFKRLDIRS